jgi:hypothetical protein
VHGRETSVQAAIEVDLDGLRERARCLVELPGTQARRAQSRAAKGDRSRVLQTSAGFKEASRSVTGSGMISASAQCLCLDEEQYCATP